MSDIKAILFVITTLCVATTGTVGFVLTHPLPACGWYEVGLLGVHYPQDTVDRLCPVIESEVTDVCE